MRKFIKIIIFTALIVAVVFFMYSFTFSSESLYGETAEVVRVSEKSVEEKPVKLVKHLKTPEPLKAIYMTQCVASRKDLRSKMVDLIDSTELNAIVVDIKDYTGTLSFNTGNFKIDSLGGSGCKVSDMKEFLEELHNKDIYVIGRITVFQDPLYTKLHPDLAVKRLSDKEAIWKDRKGISFIDVGARDYWDHILAIATSSYAFGFDEINFDYIRFPSDGDMKDIYFSHTGTTTKKEMLRQFFSYLDQNLKNTGIITSADIFGMTTTNADDLNIGQILEYALLNFDYVAPMVYPSHYPPKFNGWPDPNKVPYEIVKFSMSSAVARNNFLRAEISSTTRVVNGQVVNFTPDPRIVKRINPLQLRPWLQDNDYPVRYTPEMVRAQIQATYDSGLTSWMLWDAANTYTREALLGE